MQKRKRHLLSLLAVAASAKPYKAMAVSKPLPAAPAPCCGSCRFCSPAPPSVR